MAIKQPITYDISGAIFVYKSMAAPDTIDPTVLPPAGPSVGGAVTLNQITGIVQGLLPPNLNKVEFSQSIVPTTNVSSSIYFNFQCLDNKFVILYANGYFILKSSTALPAKREQIISFSVGYSILDANDNIIYKVGEQNASNMTGIDITPSSSIYMGISGLTHSSYFKCPDALVNTPLRFKFEYISTSSDTSATVLGEFYDFKTGVFGNVI